MTMQKINEFPAFLDAHDINPHSVRGFCELIRLFTYVDTALVQSTALEQAPSKSSYSKEELQCISTDLDSRALYLNSLGDLQIADIETTRAWLRSLLWQHAASRFMLESDARNVHFTPEYPLHLARDLLSFLSKVQSNSIRAHAYSMVSLHMPSKTEVFVFDTFVGSQTFPSSALSSRHHRRRPFHRTNAWPAERTGACCHCARTTARPDCKRQIRASFPSALPYG